MDEPESHLVEGLITPSFSESGPSYLEYASLVIKNRLGLHARAAGKLVEAAKPFESEIFMVKGDREADVRSILSLISLGCPYNTEVVLKATGPDASEALKAISTVIENRFGES